ncbi:PD-(D/E)XK motif protein [Kocuria sp. CPCC 205231]|uniref:PD-(D/E)XK motif protein n=1 Tax=Kocuria sp. CPCC 205231 TaxID=3073551 RepID=UPI0034D70C0D
MTPTPTSARPAPLDRLTPENLEDFFTARHVSTHALDQQLGAVLHLDPHAERLHLKVADDGSVPDVHGLERVTVGAESTTGGHGMLVLSIDARHAHMEAYGMVLSVVDGMRSGQNFADAADSALRQLRMLLKARRRLSEQQQIGLLGELLVLQGLVERIGAGAALDSWLGPLAEEHDFVFATYDVEVKTTVSERRVHMISGDTQLQASPGRPLWLVSLQLTRAGTRNGVTLSDQITRVRSLLDTGRPDFDDHLENLGWLDIDAPLYDERFLWRAGPQAYLVDDDFPAVTHERLAATVPRVELVTRLSYAVDVTDLDHATPGAPLDGVLVEPPATVTQIY